MKKIIAAFAIVIVLIKLMGVDAPMISSSSPDMSSVFGSSSSDAKKAAAFFYSLAETIEWDGNLDNPKLQSDLALEQYRVNALTFTTRGWGFNSKFPNFGQQVGLYLDSVVGTEPENKLDRSRREKWVKAWRAIADSCAEAGKGVF